MVSVALEMRAAATAESRAAIAIPHPAEFGDLVLRVTGGQPLLLRGVMFAEASSWSPSVPVWHEVALYRTAGQDCAVTLRTLNKAIEAPDVSRAARFPSVPAALAWLEGFDPTADLQPGFDVDDGGLSTARMALRAAGLRTRVDAVAAQWRCMLGELLYRFALRA